jgi:hypothetical protein
MKFFNMEDKDRVKVLWSKFCVWCRQLLWYEKQNETAVTHFDNVALLLVPSQKDNT